MFFNKKSYSSRESGNVFFFIVLGIVLFGALSYTVVNTSDTGSTSLLTENQAKISQADLDAYRANVRAGITQLQLEGCKSIDYTIPADQGAGDKSCHLFHHDGAAVSYREFGAGYCPNGKKMTELDIGEICKDIVYAGELSGVRLYTTISDIGQYTWNNGSINWTDTPADSFTDGLANTNILVNLVDAGSPHNAAIACRALGNEWYLPAIQEIDVLYNNRALIGNFDLTGTDPTGWYWASTEHSNAFRALARRFTGGGNFANKNSNFSVRCVRRD